MFPIIFSLLILFTNTPFASSTKQGCMMCHQGNESETKTIKKHINYLSQNKLEGRLTGSKGELLATQYVAEFLVKNGYLAASDKSDFFQTFSFLSPRNHKKKQLEML